MAQSSNFTYRCIDDIGEDGYLKFIHSNVHSKDRNCFLYLRLFLRLFVYLELATSGNLLLNCVIETASILVKVLSVKQHLPLD